MKRLTTLLLTFTVAAAAFAVPAKRQKVTLTQADGTPVVAYLMGDEYYHYYVTENTGEILYLDADGHCYRPTTEAIAQRQALAEQRIASANFHRTRAPKRIEIDRTVDKTPFDLHGQRRALVILVDFYDRPMTYTHEDFEAQLNEVGYSVNNAGGSVHDYFYEQSYGQFDLTFDVVGPVTVSKKASYYGSNDKYGNDKYPATMVAEACDIAHEQGIDFADYDWNEDGEAEMIVCIYAGYGEAQGGSDNTVWPHQWTFSEALEYGDGPGRYEIGGTFIDRYLVLNELYSYTGKRLDGIGTFCHEYSHGLGLPDVYNTEGGSTFGMNAWSLMDSGCYNGDYGFGVSGDGTCPCAYTAYERWYCGWLEPTELYYGTEIENMQPITESPEAYVIYNEANRNEYYLLQNIQQKGWNIYAPGHGMLVMHVDYDPQVWDYNTVNNDKNRRRLTIIPADNNTYVSSNGMAGDPYPGTKKNKRLTDESLPAATLYTRNVNNKMFMSKPIEEITETFTDDSDYGTISFRFNGGEVVGITTAMSEATSESNVVYDLSGHRIDRITCPGIYYVNGRMTIVR